MSQTQEAQEHIFYGVATTSFDTRELSTFQRAAYLKLQDRGELWIAHPMTSEIPALLWGIDAASIRGMTELVLKYLADGYVAVAVWIPDTREAGFKVVVFSQVPGKIDVAHVYGFTVTYRPVVLMPMKHSFWAIYNRIRRTIEITGGKPW